mgnify:CR=1 FL=1
MDSDVDPQAAARLIAGAMMVLPMQLIWEPNLDLEASRDVLTAMLTGRFSQSPPLS